jgi:hypothetical protein
MSPERSSLCPMHAELRGIYSPDVADLDPAKFQLPDPACFSLNVGSYIGPSEPPLGEELFRLRPVTGARPQVRRGRRPAREQRADRAGLAALADLAAGDPAADLDHGSVETVGGPVHALGSRAGRISRRVALEHLPA